MAEVTIRFRHNPATGKRELIIGYESDGDALPHEHERDHRALAEQLLGVPLGDDVGEIRVERVQKSGAVIEGELAREAERQREAAKAPRG
jgi:hypothetical protein